MFGKKAELLKAVERARDALASSDLRAIGRAHEELKFARYEAAPRDPETQALLDDLERHRAMVAGRELTKRARPCARCGGGDIAVSETFTAKLEVDRGGLVGSGSESPKLRMW